MRMTEADLNAAQDRIKALGGAIRENRCLDTRKAQNQPRTPDVPESVILRQCIQILATHPQVAFWWRQNSGGMPGSKGRYIKFGFRGASDLMAVLKHSGRLCGVETKKTGGKLTPDQKAFLEALNEAGGLGLMVDDPQQLIDALQAIKR